MEAVMTQVTTSISEFKKNPNESVAQAGNRAFAVLTNNKPSFYVVPPELFERIADIIFDLELTPKLRKRIAESGRAVRVNIDKL
jgi:antitoxin StbD